MKVKIMWDGGKIYVLMFKCPNVHIFKKKYRLMHRGYGKGGHFRTMARAYYPYKHESWFYSNLHASYPLDYEKLRFLSDHHDEYKLIIQKSILLIKKKKLNMIFFN